VEAVLDVSESEELSRRSMEMEARLEQLQHLEDDFKQLEGSIKTGQEAVERLQIERTRQSYRELGNTWVSSVAWGATWFQQSTVLDKATRQIQELLDRLPVALLPRQWGRNS